MAGKTGAKGGAKGNGTAPEGKNINITDSSNCYFVIAENVNGGVAVPPMPTTGANAANPTLAIVNPAANPNAGAANPNLAIANPNVVVANPIPATANRTPVVANRVLGAANATPAAGNVPKK